MFLLLLLFLYWSFFKYWFPNFIKFSICIFLNFTELLYEYYSVLLVSHCIDLYLFGIHYLSFIYFFLRTYTSLIIHNLCILMLWPAYVRRQVPFWSCTDLLADIELLSRLWSWKLQLVMILERRACYKLSSWLGHGLCFDIEWSYYLGSADQWDHWLDSAIRWYAGSYFSGFWLDPAQYIFPGWAVLLFEICTWAKRSKLKSWHFLSSKCIIKLE